ncbi:hypothetical protein FJZ31_29660 [Candidatus Poribacteria bacterium]|nr:hypothetical protein [Candidatus Poribacteria bacterium]
MAKRSLKKRVAELESRLVKVEPSVAEVTRLRFHLKNELLGEIQPLTADNPTRQVLEPTEREFFICLRLQRLNVSRPVPHRQGWYSLMVRSSS